MGSRNSNPTTNRYFSETNRVMAIGACQKNVYTEGHRFHSFFYISDQEGRGWEHSKIYVTSHTMHWCWYPAARMNTHMYSYLLKLTGFVCAIVFFSENTSKGCLTHKLKSRSFLRNHVGYYRRILPIKR